MKIFLFPELWKEDFQDNNSHLNNTLHVIPPKLLYYQIPDHGVLELLIEIHPIIDIGQKDRPNNLLEFASLVGFAVISGHNRSQVFIAANTGAYVAEVEAMFFGEFCPVNLDACVRSPIGSQVALRSCLLALI